MITRTARIETETDVASLARAVFRVEHGRGGESLMRRGEMALLEANPSLRTKSGLVPGRRIVIPQVDGLSLTARVTDDGESIGDPAVEALAGLGGIATTFERGAKTARLRREGLLYQAGQEDVRSIIQRDLGGETAVLSRAVAATRQAQRLEDRQLETLRTALNAARDAFEAAAQRESGRPGRTDRDDTDKPR
jgi:hypothetical protein